MSKEIEQLKTRFHDQQAQREAERKKHEPNVNERMAADTPDVISTYDFWCDACEEDFSSAAWKEVHRIYGDPVVTYRTRHECGTLCTRLVSHRDHDQYYHQSVKVRLQRNQYVAEMLRPDDFGFRSLYGDPEFDKTLREAEEKAIEEERERGFRGLSHETQEKLLRIRNG